MEIDPKCFPAAVPSVSKKYLGHELLSEVIEAGSDVDGFKAGDCVVLRIDWPSCFQMEFTSPCRQCNAGNYMLCENLGKVNLSTLDTGGGFSPFMIMHKSQPQKVSDAIDDDEAALIEPTACAIHALLKIKFPFLNLEQNCSFLDRHSLYTYFRTFFVSFAASLIDISRSE